jgi:hypothetical protein
MIIMIVTGILCCCGCLSLLMVVFLKHSSSTKGLQFATFFFRSSIALCRVIEFLGKNQGENDMPSYSSGSSKKADEEPLPHNSARQHETMQLNDNGSS